MIEINRFLRYNLVHFRDAFTQFCHSFKHFSTCLLQLEDEAVACCLGLGFQTCKLSQSIFHMLIKVGHMLTMIIKPEFEIIILLLEHVDIGLNFHTFLFCPRLHFKHAFIYLLKCINFPIFVRYEIFQLLKSL